MSSIPTPGLHCIKGSRACYSIRNLNTEKETNQQGPVLLSPVLLCHCRVLCIPHNGATISHFKSTNVMSTLRLTPTGLPLVSCALPNPAEEFMYMNQSLQYSLHSSILTYLTHHSVIHLWN